VSHIVLLGDSIFDNRAYTEGGPDVVSQVQELLPLGSHATLLAVDGSTTEDIPSQAQRIPSDATHLVLSVGGNDAIMNSDVLLKSFDSPVTALAKLADLWQELDTPTSPHLTHNSGRCGSIRALQGLASSQRT
jgi:hypothetical protein